jgi:hypothetical protein
MSVKIPLYLSYAVTTLSVGALVISVVAVLLGVRIAPKLLNELRVASFVWPLALVFVTVYRRKLAKANA